MYKIKEKPEDFVVEEGSPHYCKGNYDKICYKYGCSQHEGNSDKPYICCIHG